MGFMRLSCLLKYPIGCVVVVLLTNRAVAQRPAAELQKYCDGGNAQYCKKLGDKYRRSHLPDAEAKATALYQKACDNWYWVGCVKVKMYAK
jgi:hypothetical protein